MTWLIVVIVIVAALAAAVAYTWYRSAALRRRFGPEYERVLAQEGGDQRRAAAALRERTRRRATLQVHALDPDVHARYRDRWHALQGHFVDDPRGAVGEAAGLVGSVLRERGYQGDDPTATGGPTDDELDLVAVDHPEPATRSRAAQRTERDDAASTEQLRQAFQGHRALFDAVLVRHEDTTTPEDEERDAAAPAGTGGMVHTLRSARTGVRHRLHDLRRRRDDGGEASGDGRPAAGVAARFRRQPAEPEIR